MTLPYWDHTMKLGIILVAVFSLLGCASPKHDNYVTYKKHDLNSIRGQKLSIALDEERLLDIRGRYSEIATAGQNNVMYSGAAGAAGFLAQIATHAAVSDNAKNEHLKKIQTEANRVLLPHAERLSNLKQSILISDTDRYSFVESKELDHLSELNLVSNPVFYLSQDGRTLSLLHKVALFHEQRLKYQNIVEIVDIVDDQVDTSISTDELINSSKRLYKKSIELVIQDIDQNFLQEGVVKTYKFNMPEEFRVERGSLLSSACGYQTIRNLRGWIISYNDSVSC